MKCDFCGMDIPRGTELIFVNKRGKAFYYCSSKCDKNQNKLGRKPRETKWTAAYKEEKDIRVKGLPASTAVKEEEVAPKEAPVPEEEKKAPAPKKPKEPKEVKKKK